MVNHWPVDVCAKTARLMIGELLLGPVAKFFGSTYILAAVGRLRHVKAMFHRIFGAMPGRQIIRNRSRLRVKPCTLVCHHDSLLLFVIIPHSHLWTLKSVKHRFASSSFTDLTNHCPSRYTNIKYQFTSNAFAYTAKEKTISYIIYTYIYHHTLFIPSLQAAYNFRSQLADRRGSHRVERMFIGQW